MKVNAGKYFFKLFLQQKMNKRILVIFLLFVLLIGNWNLVWLKLINYRRNKNLF